jgi:hypothetical protein
MSALSIDGYTMLFDCPCLSDCRCEEEQRGFRAILNRSKSKITILSLFFNSAPRKVLELVASVASVVSDFTCSIYELWDESYDLLTKLFQSQSLRLVCFRSEPKFTRPFERALFASLSALRWESLTLQTEVHPSLAQALFELPTMQTLHISLADTFHWRARSTSLTSLNINNIMDLDEPFAFASLIDAAPNLKSAVFYRHSDSLYDRDKVYQDIPILFAALARHKNLQRFDCSVEVVSSLSEDILATLPTTSNGAHRLSNLYLPTPACSSLRFYRTPSCAGSLWLVVSILSSGTLFPPFVLATRLASAISFVLSFLSPSSAPIPVTLIVIQSCL